MSTQQPKLETMREYAFFQNGIEIGKGVYVENWQNQYRFIKNISEGKEVDKILSFTIPDENIRLKRDKIEVVSKFYCLPTTYSSNEKLAGDRKEFEKLKYFLENKK